MTQQMNFSNWTDSRAVRRAKQLPTELQPYLLTDDPYWSTLPVGWTELVLNLHEELLSVVKTYTIHQIKQKFGSLVYHTDIDYDPTCLPSKLISSYQQRSATICGRCGRDGSITNQLVVVTLCETCSGHQHV